MPAALLVDQTVDRKMVQWDVAIFSMRKQLLVVSKFHRLGAIGQVIILLLMGRQLVTRLWGGLVDCLEKLGLQASYGSVFGKRDLLAFFHVMKYDMKYPFKCCKPFKNIPDRN